METVQNPPKKNDLTIKTTIENYFEVDDKKAPLSVYGKTKYINRNSSNRKSSFRTLLWGNTKLGKTTK